jgi:serine/threonine protein kinase
MVGETFSHYRVLDKLGEGGMGVVYRAQDTRLSRQVALKILSASAVANPDRKKRFMQEARTASALNHPNIITVYDIDCADGTDFIAMEFVDGVTLEHAIGHRGLPLAEVLRYAIEIADALSAAHAAGVVHRDLKPGNIMVTGKGRIKVLDFGLAKLGKRDADDIAGDERVATASLTWNEGPRTEEGTIVGTVAYMSPEQASSRKVDRRSDIFSFGSVLYEMLTGSRPFRGDNKISILAAILQNEPQPASEILPALPPELDRLISRCLRKDPERRFQHMDDVRVALQDLKEESESGRLPLPTAPTPPPRTRVPAWLIAAAFVAIAAAAAGAWWLSRPKPAESLNHLVRLTSDPGLTWEPALASDGKLIAYASDRGAAGDGNLDIWVQQVSGGEPIRLTDNPADDREPTFSPDNSKIAFRSDREGDGIYVAPALGGEARLIAAHGRTPRFSPDGQWIAYWIGNQATGDPSAPGSAQGYVVASTGGAPRQLRPEFSVIRYPIWSPDGKYLLFWGKLDPKDTAPNSIDWWVAPLEGGAAVKTGASALLRSRNLSAPMVPGAWLADGRLMFSAERGDSSDLWQLSIAAGAWKVGGAPTRLTTGTGMSEQPSVVMGRDSAGRSVTRVAFSGLTRNTQIWRLPLDANKGKVLGALQRLTQGPATALFGSLSADGRRLVFARSKAGDEDIWIKDLRTGRELDLTPTPADQFHPRISADGSKVSYSERRGGTRSIYTMSIGSAADGALRPGVPEKLCDGCRWTWQWSWDGTKILFDPGAAGRPHIMLANLVSGEKVRLLGHPQYNLYQSNSSPDGRWVAFLAHVDSQHGHLFIAPFRPTQETASNDIPADWIPIPPGPLWDDKPRWSPDGNLLYSSPTATAFSVCGVNI